MQELHLLAGEKTLAVYPVSTSKHGLGNAIDSFKTPVGMHRVESKIGAGVPLNGRLKGRRFTGEIVEPLPAGEDSEEDCITSRILRLKGTEPGLNLGEGCDSFERLIYVHGTHEESKIGLPVSQGCIRMKNRDVVELFEAVDEGTPVYVIPDGR